VETWERERERSERVEINEMGWDGERERRINEGRENEWVRDFMW
jgi:hypothetical protein